MAGPGRRSEGSRSESVKEIFRLLAQGEVSSLQPVPWGSNYTFLVTLADGQQKVGAIYKPRRGEAPLWDFPQGTLYLREYASYVLSQALGWPSIPSMVIREGPMGVGSFQLFIRPQAAQDLFTLKAQHAAELQRVAVFDVLVNNADRKGGHCLLDEDGRLWVIDHGLTFHTDPKLRTVLWDWSGQPIPAPIIEDLKVARPKLNPQKSLWRSLGELLAEEEVEALSRRWDALLERSVFPLRGPYRSVPWPPF